MTIPMETTTVDPAGPAAGGQAGTAASNLGGRASIGESTPGGGNTAKSAPPPTPHAGGGGDTGGHPDEAAKARGSTGGDTTMSRAAGSNRAGGPKAAVVDGVKGLLKSQHEKGRTGAGKIGNAAADKLANVPFAPKIPLVPSMVRSGARFLPWAVSLIAGSMALDDFKNQRWVSGVLNTIGVIPGPIGWLGMGSAVVYNLFFGGGGNGTAYGLWEAPDGVRTFMLPAAAAETENVLAVDKALTDAQREVFGFADGPSGTVWNSNAPAALRVDSPEVAQAITTWLAGVRDVFHQLRATMVAAGEPYIAEQVQKLAPHFTAMAALPESGRLITAQLTASSSAAESWYRSVLEANEAARAQLAQGGTLSDSAPAQRLNTVRQRSRDAIAAADQKLSTLVSDKALAPVTPRVVPAGRASTGDQPAAALPPAGALPGAAAAPPNPAGAATPAPPSAPGRGDNADDVSKFLDSLRNATPVGNPLGGGSPLGGVPMGMPLGGMPMVGAPLGGGTPLGGVPKPTPLTTPGDKPKRATERPLLSGSPPENKTVPAAKIGDTKPATEKEKVTPPVPGAAASTAAPSGDKSAPASSASAKPAAQPTPDNTVEVKGRKVEFPDAKHAALARELSTAAPGSPASLADAATKAGLVPPVPGQDPGQQVAPADAKPGNLLRAGDKDFMLLDKGKFLDFSNGRVIDADQVPKDLGLKGGYFKLLDAGGGQPAGPVPGPTPDTTSFAVDRTPKVPTDASPGAASAPPAAPTWAHAGESAGVTSSGSPGVPARGTGPGPANAAATDTGLGTGSVTVGRKPLDPTAIR